MRWISAAYLSIGLVVFGYVGASSIRAGNEPPSPALSVFIIAAWPIALGVAMEVSAHDR